ncbi:hydrogenase maturation factor [Methylorubrum rhodinum]|uniref:Hydrogenase maturation factor n=1 Tax=Methylorubrum rhodinum TaxID=29428 RepID=A0A840ZRE9_9HYPH|nr:hypothetical protein [Methylorubrum rhodinum]MBB5759283.1 hydrogenase maturation factor [Methylorubrum rhodinum]
MAGDDELFEIELQGVEREVDIDMENGGATREAFGVSFHCGRPGCWMLVHVRFDVKDVPTLEVVPRGMAGMHRAFAALARQSEAWAAKG